MADSFAMTTQHCLNKSYTSYDDILHGALVQNEKNTKISAKKRINMTKSLLANIFQVVDACTFEYTGLSQKIRIL